jgi:homoserine dehydrogenase
MKKIRLGILGFGTVGGGTVGIINNTIKEIERRLGRHTTIVIEQIALRNLTKKRAVDTSGIKITTNPLDVVNNPDVDIVVELMGGTSLAKECFEIAIANKKHIVTANKALIAEQGNELFAEAAKNNVVIAYEAAIAGGIPVVKAIREGLSANKINWVAGIINGTGNYILSEMKQPNADFGKVLKVAQDLGYAEADPTFDVEGIDAAHKLTILASIAFGIKLQFSKIYTEGISKITAEDITFAQQLGYQIKHLGLASRTKDGFSLRVHPTLVPNSALIANVDGVMNAVMVNGDSVGTTMYYGAGAGAGPTASAVVADIIDIIRGLEQPPQDRVSGLGFALNSLKVEPVIDITEIECHHYLRCFAKDKKGVLATITKMMSDSNISIDNLHQEPCSTNKNDATLVILTNKVKESSINKLLEKLASFKDIDGEIQRIRIDSLE